MVQKKWMDLRQVIKAKTVEAERFFSSHHVLEFSNTVVNNAMNLIDQ